MAKVLITESILEDTADAIREKTGSVDTMTPSEFAENISDIPQGADVSDYFNSSIGGGDSASSAYNNFVKTIPASTQISGTSLGYAFTGCGIFSIPSLNTSNVTTMSYMCQGCSNLESVSTLNTSQVTNMSYAFSGCNSLTTIPQFNTSSITKITNIFSNTPNLTDTSLDNILLMCININPSYSRAKTLTELGIKSSNYPASRIEALPHYQDFLNAGWTTGY